MKQNSGKQFFLEFISDLLCLLLANTVSYLFFRYVYVRINYYPSEEWGEFGRLLLFSFVLVFLFFHRTLDIKQRNRLRELVAVFKNSVTTYLVLIALLALTKNGILDSRYLLVSGFALTTLNSIVMRYFLKRWMTGRFSSTKAATLVGIITSSGVSEEFIEELKQDWSIRISGIALLDMEENKITELYDIPVVANRNTFMDWVRSSPLDEVYINFPFDTIGNAKELIEELEDMGITVHINIPSLNNFLDESKFDNINCRMFAGYPIATFSAKVQNEVWLAAKRFVDIVVGSIGCIISIPIIAIVAVPLLIESPGGLFFKQDRVGKNGRIFTCYKLRSMVKDAEAQKAGLMANNQMQGHMFKMDNDPRVTKVGAFIRKTSIDELPQFFNVVKGDMSLIGTRPPTVDEFNQYESRHKRRLSMRPGITGMWQVSGRSNIEDFEEVVKLDCKYIDEWSPMLDIKIFFKTILVLLTRSGAK